MAGKRTQLVTVDYDGGAAGQTVTFRNNDLRGFVLDQLQLHSNAEIQYSSNLWLHHQDPNSEDNLELNGSLLVENFGLKIDGVIEFTFILGANERVKLLMIGKETD